MTVIWRFPYCDDYVAAIHAPFIDFFPAVDVIVVIVHDANLRKLAHFLLLIKNQTWSIKVFDNSIFLGQFIL